MLTINNSDIVLSQVAVNKTEAITSVAASLTEKGYVEAGYREGMLGREAQTSTFLGNGIAIPHGTTDTRDMVNKTGVIVHHFPEGVDWGDDNTVYLAIGIAAKSDEHLTILTQLTKVLSTDGVEDLLKNATKADTIVDLLSGKVQSETEFNSELIQLNGSASDLTALSANAANLIKNQGLVNDTFVNETAGNATNLGQGLWLTSSCQGVTKTALSFVTSAQTLQSQGQPVKGLLCVASNSALHLKNLNFLTALLYSNKIDKLLSASEKEIVTLLTQELLEGSQQTFTIKNPHGLHARPGAMLVHTAKQFKAKIQMTNLDGTSKTENAKSLMKVMTLGVKFGNKLQFTAQGEDAEAALIAIGKAIEAGLGEKIA
ncbi:fused PTS fructose transporter subunit IIA/HPr protein [Psychromonas antarctica]|uniref:fused PTS fructose transporter subunit IIA/HPr protein n=1 Tax=Psychromonas antarctica TaxID=67573 RepID=UPI001EE847A4|nr:fused PTS fructose transporter subunit IIA/HPr protein [Psychromonas antarctica]MCG6201965.1 fused PTS fructose transporter subunit IIA/HPr protein [Psychromonas antarctica]